jgi:DNA primase
MPLVPAPRIDTDRLRHEHPIGELVERYGIELRRSGSSLTGRCPFHLDRGRPNLTVFPRSGRFMCFAMWRTWRRHFLRSTDRECVIP